MATGGGVGRCWGVLPFLLAACGQGPSPCDEARLLVQGLGSDAIEERDLAFLRLLDLGRSAVGEIERGAEDSDSEIASRCDELLNLLAPVDLEVRRFVAHCIHHAIRDFDREQYERAIVFANMVLAIDGAYPIASAIRERAEIARHANYLYPLAGTFREWQRETEMIRGRIPEPAIFHYPAESDWPRLRRDVLRRFHEASSGAHDRECTAVSLELMHVTFDFHETPVEEILAALGEASGLNMVVDAASGSALASVRRMDLVARNKSLRSVLIQVLEKLAMEYVITEECILLLRDVK
jgi:hypothetical protein